MHRKGNVRNLRRPRRHAALLALAILPLLSGCAWVSAIASVFFPSDPQSDRLWRQGYGFNNPPPSQDVRTHTSHEP
jgi:hypothetical protein